MQLTVNTVMCSLWCVVVNLYCLQATSNYSYSLILEILGVTDTDNIVGYVLLIDLYTCAGESCGEGTLDTLKNMVTERNLAYSCYDVFGDPSSQAEDLSVCASKIITAVQQGVPYYNDQLSHVSQLYTECAGLY